MKVSKKLGLLVLFLFSSVILMGAFSVIDFSTQVGNKPTSLGGYGITDALSTTLPSGRIWIGNGSNAASTTAISGDATLANTGELTLAVSGASAGTYNSVTVDTKGRVTAGSTVAVVTGVSGTAPVSSSGGTTPAISMAAATNAVDGYMTATSMTLLEGKAAKMAAAKRETVTMGAAGATVTFAGTPVPSTIDAAVVTINGLIQAEGVFTRTSNKIIESTAGDIPAGAKVTILNLE